MSCLYFFFLNVTSKMEPPLPFLFLILPFLLCSLRPEAFGTILFRCSKTCKWTLFITTCILYSEITASEAKHRLFQGTRFQTGVPFVPGVSKYHLDLPDVGGNNSCVSIGLLDRTLDIHSFFSQYVHGGWFILNVRVARTASFSLESIRGQTLW